VLLGATGFASAEISNIAWHWQRQQHTFFNGLLTLYLEMPLRTCGQVSKN